MQTPTRMLVVGWIFLAFPAFSLSPGCLRDLKALNNANPTSLFDALSNLNSKKTRPEAELRDTINVVLTRLRGELAEQGEGSKSPKKEEAAKLAASAVAAVLRLEEIVPEPERRLALAMNFLETARTTGDFQEFARDIKTLRKEDSARTEAFLEKFHKKAVAAARERHGSGDDLENSNPRSAEIWALEHYVIPQHGAIGLIARESAAAATDLKKLSHEKAGVRWLDPAFLSHSWNARSEDYSPLPAETQDEGGGARRQRELKEAAMRELTRQGHYILFTTVADMDHYLPNGAWKSLPTADIVSVTFDADFRPALHFSECRSEEKVRTGKARVQLGNSVRRMYDQLGAFSLGGLNLFRVAGPNEGPGRFILLVAGQPLPVDLKPIEIEPSGGKEPKGQ